MFVTSTPGPSNDGPDRVTKKTRDRRHDRRRGDRAADDPPAASMTAAARPGRAGDASTAAGRARGRRRSGAGHRRRCESAPGSPARATPAAPARRRLWPAPRGVDLRGQIADQLLDAGPVRCLRLQPQVVAVQLARPRQVIDLAVDLELAAVRERDVEQERGLRIEAVRAFVGFDRGVELAEMKVALAVGERRLCGRVVLGRRRSEPSSAGRDRPGSNRRPAYCHSARIRISGESRSVSPARFFLRTRMGAGYVRPARTRPPRAATPCARRGALTAGARASSRPRAARGQTAHRPRAPRRQCPAGGAAGERRGRRRRCVDGRRDRQARRCPAHDTITAATATRPSSPGGDEPRQPSRRSGRLRSDRRRPAPFAAAAGPQSGDQRRVIRRRRRLRRGGRRSLPVA